MKFNHIFLPLVLTAALVACNNAKNEAHHHDDPLQLTAYCDSIELYAEATPLAVGVQSKIKVHLTRLSDFKPLEASKVTASLIVGEDGIRQTADKPVSPGIYDFDLTPDKAGQASLVFDIETKWGNRRMAIEGLKVYQDPEEAEHNAAKAVATSSNGVAFAKEMSWKVNFATEEVQMRPVQDVIRTSAQVMPAGGDVFTLTAKNAGVVRFADMNLTEGSAVATGKTLFTIDGSTNADNNLQVQISQAKNDYEAAKAAFERDTELAGDRLVTQSQLRQSKNAYLNAKAAYDNLRNRFGGAGSAVATPFAGYVTNLAVTNGQQVQSGQTLATVSQNRNIILKAQVQARHFDKLSGLSGANVKFADGHVKSLDELDGKIISFGRNADSESGLLPVVLSVGKTEQLLPGAFVDIYLYGNGTGLQPSVPVEALVEEMGNYFVYVQMTPEYFEKREVAVGNSDGKYARITAGVSPGERVVSRGAVLVKLSQGSGKLDPHAGHVH